MAVWADSSAHSGAPSAHRSGSGRAGLSLRFFESWAFAVPPGPIASEVRSWSRLRRALPVDNQAGRTIRMKACTGGRVVNGSRL